VTSHGPRPRQQDGLAPSRPTQARCGRFELAFARHGAHTRLGRQFVSYPFHMTRPFALDAAIPSLLTVYQQSSSGGLYRAEELRSRYELGAAAAAHITTQSATVVHDCHGQPARQTSEMTLSEGAFLALTPDPLILFPGASCSSTIEARLAPGAVLFLSDAFACHDPEGRSRRFARLSSDVVIRDSGGRLLVRDNLEVSGAQLAGPASPIGLWSVVSTFMLLGDSARLPIAEALVALNRPSAAITGVTALANGAGWGVRCLAIDAIAARGMAQSLFALAIGAAFGQQPAPRRK
jgi:urease accessory protein